MSNLIKVNSLLRNQEFSPLSNAEVTPYIYAESIAAIENAVVVVSDLKQDSSRIFCGDFADILGIDSYLSSNSIWEKEILQLLDDDEREMKYISEIRFFNFIRKQSAKRRSRYYLQTQLRFKSRSEKMIDVTHKMFYYYDKNGSARYGICIYLPATGAQKAKSVIIDTLTGASTILGSGTDNDILSKREREVLQLIERGRRSCDIAEELCISKHTVSRHRQEILAKLQVRNSTEACRLARQLNII